jgi:uncharacterized hydrophobic protein (TIGR00271 family)
VLSSGKNIGDDGVQSTPSIIASKLSQPSELVLKAVRDGSEPTRVYWLMNALATVIACYGLFTNSPAVVIGSMVVAMLLNPIAGVAMGLNNSDRPLLRTALLSLAGGIVWILTIATVVGLIHHEVPLTAEVLSRTKPDLFELIIALASGAAGAVAVLSARVGTALVGVAVATALVPPLAAAGILLARGDFVLAGGAFLLAVTNVAAIQVAFSAVFWVGGYRRITAVGRAGFLAFLRKDLLSVGFLFLLAIVFGVQLHNAINTSFFESGVRAALRGRFNELSGFRVVDVSLAKQAGTTVVRAVVRGPKVPSPEIVAAAQSDLPAPPDGSALKLRVRFVETVIVTPQGPVIEDDSDEH